MPIGLDIIPNGSYTRTVLSDEGPLSRSDPSSDRAKAGLPGAPRDGRQAGGQGGAPGGAAPYVTGRARCLAARGGYVNPASRGARLVPWRLPPLHPLARVSRGTGKARTHSAARTRKCGCLKFESLISCPGRDAALFALLRRPGIVPDPAFVTAPALQRTASRRATRCAASGARKPAATISPVKFERCAERLSETCLS